MALSDLPFVKFQRGTPSQYDRLANKDANSLYFITDPQHPEEGGKLYMGSTLIGGTGAAAGATSLAGLSDVDLAGVTLSEGMLLRYDSTNSKWSAVEGPMVASGAKTGAQTDANVLATVDPTPLAGDIVFVDDVPYIYYGNSWHLLVGQDLEDRVAAVESNLQSVDGRISSLETAISTSNHLVYTTVSALPNVSDADDNTVYLVGNSSTSGGDKYEEYLLVNGAFEKIGHFEPDLSNYVTLSSFNSAVGDINSSIAGLQSNLNDYVTINQYDNEIGDIADLRTLTGDNTATVVDGIVDLYGRLQWNAMTN